MDPRALLIGCLITVLTVTFATSMPIGETVSPCQHERCFMRDCTEILQNNSSAPSSDYVIQPHDDGPEFTVYCDMRDDGGWTMIQRREDGLVNFYRGWEGYKQGFGNVHSEHWMGNERIHRLTSDGNYELLVEIVDAANVYKFARYSHFRIGTEWSDYMMKVESYSGTAGDSLTYHNGKPFSTYDRDNDSSTTGNCALVSNAGWWYHNCYKSTLNGPYLTPGTIPTANHHKGIIWYTYKGNNYSHKQSAMMVRRVNRDEL